MLCLPALAFPFKEREKHAGQKNTNYLAGGSKEHCEQRVLAPRNMQQAPPLWVKKKKRTLNANLGKIVFWDTSPSSSLSVGFPNKVTIPLTQQLVCGFI